MYKIKLLQRTHRKVIYVPEAANETIFENICSFTLTGAPFSGFFSREALCVHPADINFPGGYVCQISIKVIGVRGKELKLKLRHRTNKINKVSHINLFKKPCKAFYFPPVHNDSPLTFCL